MPTYYAGAGGNDANSGLSYALRKLTLNGIESVPITAADTAYVAPGVYRELLTINVSGTAGNPITYIADVDGSHTDGVGGVVRVTGSDNDTTATRANCITATSRDYRTFTGFTFDMTTSHLVTLVTACSNWVIQDCYFSGLGGAALNAINAAGTGTTNTVRRCLFVGGRSHGVRIVHSSVVSNADYVVENCVFIGLRGNGITSARVGGVTVKHCSIFNCSIGVATDTAALTAGQTVTTNNCLMLWCSTAFSAFTSGEVVENYNALWGNSTDRTNTSVVANSNIYPPLFQPSLQLAGFRYPWTPFDLSEWSPVRRLAGTGMSADSLYGITRPATDSKKSWGAIQHVAKSRDTATVDTGTGSAKLADAGAISLLVPVTAVSTTFTCRVRFETDYAGTKPQMIIRQSGQSDTTVTATGSSGAWETLTTTMTPASLPNLIEVLLVSSNTATAGAYAAYFDGVRVT